MTVLAGTLLLFLLAVWLAHLRLHPRALPISRVGRAAIPRGWSLSFPCATPRSRVTIDGMKLVGMLVAVAALIGMFINGIGEMVGGGDNPADYPDCYDIVRQLGTDPDAKCNQYGDVITVKFDPAWKHFHPEY